MCFGNLEIRVICFQVAGKHLYFFRDLRSSLIVLGISKVLQKVNLTVDRPWPLRSFNKICKLLIQ